MPLTKLGIALGELNVTVDVPETIPYMGIEAGPVDLQRLFYYSIGKSFYDSGLSLEEMNQSNFDWFRPSNCDRHSPDEVRGFCKTAGLEMERLHFCQSGISVIARRPQDDAKR